MDKSAFMYAVTLLLLGSAAVLGQGEQQAQQAESFFIVTNPSGTDNLGEFERANRMCQNLAQAAGFGNRKWHASRFYCLANN
jgi:hypothetical protein